MITMTALVKLYDIGDVDDDHDDQNSDDKIELKNMSVEIRSDFLRLWLEWWHSYDDNLINRRKCDCPDRDDQSDNRIILVITKDDNVGDDDDCVIITISSPSSLQEEVWLPCKRNPGVQEKPTLYKKPEFINQPGKIVIFKWKHETNVPKHNQNKDDFISPWLLDTEWLHWL